MQFYSTQKKSYKFEHMIKMKFYEIKDEICYMFKITQLLDD